MQATVPDIAVAEERSTTPATDAMNVIIANYFVGEGIVDAIGKGEDTTTNDDLTTAIFIGVNFLASHPSLAENLYVENKRSKVLNWYTENTATFKSFEHKKLLEHFMNLCTMIQNILIFIGESVIKSHHKDFLHDRPVQNQPSRYQKTALDLRQSWGPDEPLQLFEEPLQIIPE